MSFLSGLLTSTNSNHYNYDSAYQALLQYYPQLQALYNQNATQNATAAAQAQLAATQATAAPMADLQNQLYQQYGSQLAGIGSQIGQQIQQNQANANATVANSAGGQAALQAAINADKAANPEFYSARANEASRIGDLLNSIDLSGNLSGSETRAIDQYLGRANQQTGTINTPSAAQAVSNAMLYGNAAYQRQEQAKSDLTNALGQATSFLPASQSGVGGMNAFNIATGGANTATQTAGNAMGLFQGTNNAASSSTANTGNILSGMLNKITPNSYGTNTQSAIGAMNDTLSAIGSII